jgi:ribokinase
MSQVTVLGSLHYDILVDAPARPRKGETITGAASRPKLGGKGGNQAVAAARAGATTSMIGMVGNDAFGAELVQNLKRHDVDTELVHLIPDTGSGMSVAIFDSDRDYGAVIVSAANLKLGNASVSAAADRIAAGKILVLQNEVPEDANCAGALIAHQAGVTVLLNAAPARPLTPEFERLIDVLVVNAIEAEALAGGDIVETLAGALAAARRLAARFPVVVVTAGGAGVACVSRDGGEIALGGISVKVESTHGAGDEFVGWLAAGLAEGLPIESALSRANAAAAALVGMPEAARA